MCEAIINGQVCDFYVNTETLVNLCWHEFVIRAIDNATGCKEKAMSGVSRFGFGSNHLRFAL
jgi:hypothetical protein